MIKPHHLDSTIHIYIVCKKVLRYKLHGNFLTCSSLSDLVMCLLESKVSVVMYDLAVTLSVLC